MTLFLTSALAWFHRNGTAIPVILLTALVAFLLGVGAGTFRERSSQELRLERVNVAALRIQRAADRVASNSRVIAETTITTQRKEVDDALASIPDARPTARQRARACIELVRQADAAGEPRPAC